MMDLDAAFSEAVGDLHKDVKILLLCNPCNPTGRIYKRETLEMVVDWCEAHKIHLVSDEIYANSIFPGQEMTSIAKVMQDRNPGEEKYMGDFVHVVAGFSKDFGVSGYRTGTLFSHNEDLLVCMSRLGYFKTVST